MSSGTQVDLDWAGSDAGQTGAAAPASGARSVPVTAKYLTDEEILGLDPGDENGQRDSSGKERPQNDTFGNGGTPRNDNGGESGEDWNTQAREASEPTAQKTAQAEARATENMPAWIQAAAADPRHAAEAAQLWREHQEFRAAFASPEEARAVKELLPGGVRDVLSLREATQSVERIDAALFSGDARAQAEVVAELARANPAAFRSLFAEAAKYLVAGSSKLETSDEWQVASGEKQQREESNLSGGLMSGSENLQRDSSGRERPQNDIMREFAGPRNDNLSDMGHESPVTGHQSPVTTHNSQVTNHESRVAGHESRNFDPVAYAAFERSTNETVARDVRGAIGDTLARVLPEGIADGAARRIGDDIFQEIHRALATDRALSEQVAAVLQGPAAAGRPRFGSVEQQRVVSLLAGRAKQLVPSLARRVIGEWTSSVLNTSRAKAARQATAASRVDIAAPGGARDSMPLRPMNRREVDYATMSDEEILGL